jgi:SH3 domain protein
MTPRRAVLLLAVVLQSPLAGAETAWVSDVFYVPLRSGPSDANRIVHKGLASGTALEVIEEDPAAGYTHVRTVAGVDGWIGTQYVVREPVAALALAAANKRVQALEQQLSQRGQTLTELRSTSDEASSTKDALAGQVVALQKELDELKRVSAGSIEEHTRNQELTTLNARLRGEVDRLVQETQSLQNSQQQRWLLIGGGLVLGGLLAGFVIKTRPRRSGWS